MHYYIRMSYFRRTQCAMYAYVEVALLLPFRQSAGVCDSMCICMSPDNTNTHTRIETKKR